LAGFFVEGIDTGIPFLQTVIDDPDYVNGRVNTRWLEAKLERYSALHSQQAMP
jgi:pyruvate carboxylase